MSDQELRVFADECIEFARVAVSDEQRDLLLQMAHTLAVPAEELEAVE